MQQKFLGLIASFIFKVYASTFRYQIHFTDEETYRLAMNDLFDLSLRPGKTFLYAFWHQDELALLPFFAGLKVAVMVSHSKDGEIMKTALENLGYVTVRGSSSRGAVAGLVHSLKKVEEGHKYAMAVDGPRGPIYKVKEGIIFISERTSRPIIPVRAFPQNYFCFKRSWNKAKLPFPFSRIEIRIGAKDFYNQSTLELALNKLQDLPGHK